MSVSVLHFPVGRTPCLFEPPVSDDDDDGSLSDSSSVESSSSSSSSSSGEPSGSTNIECAKRLLRKVLQARRTQNFPRLLRRVSRALNLEFSDPLLRVKLQVEQAFAHKERNDPQECLAAVNKGFLTLGQQDSYQMARLHRYKAWSLSITGQQDEALKEVEAALKLDIRPGTLMAKLYEEKAQILIKGKAFEEAIKAAELGIGQKHDDLRVLIKLKKTKAEALHLNQKHSEALQIIDEALAFVAVDSERRGNLYLLKSKILMELKNYKKCAEVVDQALKLPLYNYTHLKARLFYNKGVCYLNLHQNSLAIQTFRTGLGLRFPDPHLRGKFLWRQAIAYNRTSNHRRSIKVIAEGLSLFSGNPHFFSLFHLQYAKAYQGLFQYRECLKAAEEALKMFGALNPQEKVCLLLCQSIGLMETGNYYQALEPIKRGFEVSPLDVRSEVLLELQKAESNMRQNKFGQSSIAIKRAEEKAKGDPELSLKIACLR